MIMQPVKSFNAKILLFGEHTLLLNSMALSIPFDRFHGKLEKDQQIEKQDVHLHSNRQMRNFFGYLKEKSLGFNAPYALDIAALAKDLEDGLYFESNIPHGYGLGSSGALVAALYGKYGAVTDPEFFISKQLLSQLKDFFGSLESYFHGTSSGLDPLISFLNQTVVITGNKALKTIKSGWSEHKGKGAVFIIDSRVIGDTQPLVEYYRSRYREAGFKKSVDDHYIPLVNKAVKSYISLEPSELLNVVRELSAFQFNHMIKMIPEQMHEVWQSGLADGAYALKLCGSGGGGMVLGFTENVEVTKKQLAGFEPLIIHQL